MPVNNFCCSLSPRRLYRQAQKTTAENRQLRLKLYGSKKKVTRLQKKIISLQQVTKELHKKRMISSDALGSLTKSLTGIPSAILKRCMQNIRNTNKNKKQIRSQFPKELRSFAMTLQFYSTKAYEYVRKTFCLALPSCSVIRTWLSGIDCKPGFTACSFQTLKRIVAENHDRNEETLVSLLIDEIAIRKHIEFTGNRTWGYIDLGTDLEDDTLACATEAFVIMVVSMKRRWKLPIGYFFIKSLSASDKANIIHNSLRKLYDIGVKVTSLTCDGPSANFAMAKELGINYSNINDIQSFFLHPSDQSKVYMIFDPCHMIKLVRNNWAKCRRFLDDNSNAVDFNYVKLLYDRQEAEKFRFGTKIRKAHMEWEKQKMKVTLCFERMRSF